LKELSNTERSPDLIKSFRLGKLTQQSFHGYKQVQVAEIHGFNNISNCISLFKQIWPHLQYSIYSTLK